MKPNDSSTLLILGFLAVIFGVPAAQIAVELQQQSRVQCTDLFRYTPTVANLRRFEGELEDSWWGRPSVRPAMQGLLFRTLGDLGSEALAGRDDWLFYRPGVQYLVRGDGVDGDVVDAIVQYRDRLEARGIRLLVVPVPGKAAVYPERLTVRWPGTGALESSRTRRLLDELGRRGVEIVDLLEEYGKARASAESDGAVDALYLARDTHWTPRGARLAAEAIAQRLRELGWAPEGTWPYSRSAVKVERRSDILEMVQAFGLRDAYPPQTVVCTQVLDRIVGPLVPKGGERMGSFLNAHLIDSPMESSVLLLGDSYSRIYQLPEPRSLGNVVSPSEDDAEVRAVAPGRDGGVPSTKVLIPGSAGLPSLLADSLRAPVDCIASDGGAATDVRRKLRVDPEMLMGKKVVVWEFTERAIALGAAGWEDVPLPPDPGRGDLEPHRQ